MNVENLIKAFNCEIWYEAPWDEDRCKDCPFGYQILDTTGSKAFWTCDGTRMSEDINTCLKEYKKVLENENT